MQKTKNSKAYLRDKVRPSPTGLGSLLWVKSSAHIRGAPDLVRGVERWGKDEKTAGPVRVWTSPLGVCRVPPPAPALSCCPLRAVCLSPFFVSQRRTERRRRAAADKGSRSAAVARDALPVSRLRTARPRPVTWSGAWFGSGGEGRWEEKERGERERVGRGSGGQRTALMGRAGNI